jgi:hypothetical protein
MNRSFPNIEYRPFPGHKYRVGYAPLSGVWHIHGSGKEYVARCMTMRDSIGYVFARTLADMSSILACK